MADIWSPNNPGIGGLKELTDSETVFIQNLSGLSYASGDILYHNGSSLTRLAKGSDGEVLTLASGLPSWTSAGAGDVTAAAVMTDNAIVRGDGGAKGVQDTGVTISDADVMAFPTNGAIHLDTNQDTTAGVPLIKLTYDDANTNNEAKAIIAFEDGRTGVTNIWMQTHDYLDQVTQHKHFSIEATDASNLLQTRLGIGYGADVVDVTVNQADLVINRNTALTNGNIVMAGGGNGGVIKHAADLDIYPDYATNGTYALSIQHDSSQIHLAVKGASDLYIDDNIRFNGTTIAGLHLNSLTTTERDALTPVAGMVIYNETTANIEGYDGTSWLDLGGAGGLNDIVDDTTPQLGGNLDTQGFTIGNTSGGYIDFSNTDTTGHAVISSTQTLNSASGTDKFVSIAGTINNSGTAATDFLEVDATLTGAGSGQQNLMNLKGSSSSKFRVDTSGNVDIASGAKYKINGTDLAASDVAALPTAGGTMSGDIGMANNDIDNAKTVQFNGEYDNGNSSTADTIAWDNGQKQKSTLTANCTYTFTAPTSIGTFQLKVIQDATGGRTVTWPGTVKWPSGTAPTLSTGANAIDIISFYYDGTNYFGVSTLNFS